MTTCRVAFVDVYVVRRAAEGAGGLELLALRRAAAGRCPGSWEAVHGGIETGESPVDAALRELREEAGLAADRLYNLSRVESFYRHRTDEVALGPVFVALVGTDATPRPGPEHDRLEWLPAAEARARYHWPRARRAVDDLVHLLGTGHADVLEDVLRVC